MRGLLLLLLVCLIIALLTNCRARITREACLARYGAGTADTVWLHDTVQAFIPASYGAATFDSVAVASLPDGDSLQVVSTDGRATATIKRVARRPAAAQAGYILNVRTRPDTVAVPLSLPCLPQRELVEVPRPYVPFNIKFLIGCLAAAVVILSIKRA